jgi:hypothetical protein
MNRGFTLFYALLVSSLALAIGAAIFDITIREIDLASASTQSQYAVYAADSGAECALYWESKYVNAATNNNGGTNSAFATSSTDGQAVLVTGGNLNCGGADISASASWSVSSVAGSATTTFNMTGTGPNSFQIPCAIITVAKSGNPSATTITAHGYNTCVSGPLQLERVLQVTY